jgi:hypothetical protein
MAAALLRRGRAPARVASLTAVPLAMVQLIARKWHRTEQCRARTPETTATHPVAHSPSRQFAIAARITRGQPRLFVRIDNTWPWRREFATAFARLHTLTQPITEPPRRSTTDRPGDSTTAPSSP